MDRLIYLIYSIDRLKRWGKIEMKSAIYTGRDLVVYSNNEIAARTTHLVENKGDFKCLTIF